MDNPSELKLLFIVNSTAGSSEKNWTSIIQDHFKSTGHLIDLMDLPGNDACNMVSQKIQKFKPDRVVAVGGDGTVKLVAECLLHTDIGLGLVHAGSANGMAKELSIPENDDDALDLVVKGKTKKMHLIKINDELCIHLSDIGFNAFVVKKFETTRGRGMFGYIKAAWFVLWNKPEMEVKIQKDDGSVIYRSAAMIVLANATRYGSGALINPEGKLNDDLFEVIIVKKVSFMEIFKMMISHTAYNPKKTELFQTATLHVHSDKKVHFQVDGEYFGKVGDIDAALIPGCLNVIVPDKDISSMK